MCLSLGIKVFGLYNISLIIFAAIMKLCRTEHVVSSIKLWTKWCFQILLKKWYKGEKEGFARRGCTDALQGREVSEVCFTVTSSSPSYKPFLYLLYCCLRKIWKHHQCSGAVYAEDCTFCSNLWFHFAIYIISKKSCINQKTAFSDLYSSKLVLVTVLSSLENCCSCTLIA